jgi:uncharacterized protein YecE (DUF72 family)
MAGRKGSKKESTARAYVGTSGWSYAHWRGLFYPRGMKQGAWLGHYARHLGSVEINASFYRLLDSEMIARWIEATPPDFRFAVKAWRTITHFKRLSSCEEELATFFERAAPFGNRLGVVLFQLSPGLERDDKRLKRFLAELPGKYRYAFEFRHPSWHAAETYRLLERHDTSFVSFELAKLTAPRQVTASFVYVRLHGHKARYRGAYSDSALADWADWLSGRMAEGRDVYCYFDNTDEADHAVRNALTLDGFLRERTATARNR